MNQRNTSGNEDDPDDPEAPAPAEPKLVNPGLTATLHSDYEALQNDLQQANELAHDFQRQLAGKSNEFAQLKQLFEKTSHDLKSLQEGIEALRAERHRLANEAMRATAFEAKLVRVTEERDRLRIELEVIRKALAGSADKMEAALRERDSMIATLVIEAETLKRALVEAKAHKNSASASAPAAPQRYTPPPSPPPPPPPEDDFINISFGS